MSDPAVLGLIDGWVTSGTEIAEDDSRPCRAQRRVVFDVVDADLAAAGRLAARDGELSVLAAEQAGLVDLVRLGSQTLVLADPAAPLRLRLAPEPGGTLRVTVRDIDGEQSTVTVPEVSSTKALTVAVTAAGAGTVEVPADPTPTASPAPSPGPSPAPPTIPTPAPSAAPGPTAAPPIASRRS